MSSIFISPILSSWQENLNKSISFTAWLQLPCHEQNIGRNKNRELMSFSNFPKQKNLSDYVKQNDSFEAISKYRLDYPV
jgi:hypothetical protein